MAKVVIYLRVSSSEQTITNQLPALEKWVADQGHELVEVYAEFESRRRSERTLAGLARALAQGKKLGRPKGSHDKTKRRRSGYLLRYADAGLRQKYGK